MKQTPREARKALINSYKCYLETIRERVETIASVNNDAFTKQVLIESAYSFIKQVDNYGHETLINHFYKFMLADSDEFIYIDKNGCLEIIDRRPKTDQQTETA